MLKHDTLLSTERSTLKIDSRPSSKYPNDKHPFQDQIVRIQRTKIYA
jgi:hypothetical protein